MKTLKQLYDARAALAFTLEEDARREQPRDDPSHQHYAALCAEITRLSRDWLVERAAPPVPPPPAWCHTCGSVTQPRLPDHPACQTCEAEDALVAAFNPVTPETTP